jgi:hypothetical protein
VEVVGLVECVLHELQGLEMRARRGEALEEERAGFDAAHDGVSGDGSGLRGAGLAETLDPRFVGDGGVGEGAAARGDVKIWEVQF